jgi:hypothetical protein
MVHVRRTYRGLIFQLSYICGNEVYHLQIDGDTINIFLDKSQFSLFRCHIKQPFPSEKEIIID